MAGKNVFLSKLAQISNWWETKTKKIILPGLDGL
jgi:hypothetical protein